MSNYWSIDLRHYLLPDGNPASLSPQSERLFNYWAAIVSRCTKRGYPAVAQLLP